MSTNTTENTNGTTHKAKPAKGLGGVIERLDVEISKVHVPADFNVRREVDSGAVERLAASIDVQGLNDPLPVVPHPENKGEYVLVGGFTRFLALKAKRLRGTIPVTVHAFKESWGPAVVNMTGNTAANPLHPADVAKRLYELETGTYPTLDGSTPVPLDRKTVCAAVGLTPSYVGNLVRAWKKLCEPVREEWVKRRGADAIPTDMVVAWAKEESEEEQTGAYKAWSAAQEAKKARRKEGKKEGKRKVTEPDKAVPVSKAEMRKKLVTFQEKLEKGPPLKGRDLEVALAKIETLRWVSGEISRLGLT